MASDSGVPPMGAWVVIGAAAIAAGFGAFLGLPVGLLVAAGAVLTIVILLVWSSVLSLTGSTPLTLEEAVGLGAPSIEEERKQAVLRALKDLEYERGVGKISDDDYRELSARYRAEAKQLLRALDRDLAPLRDEVLKKVEARLGGKRADDDGGDDHAKPKKARKAKPKAAPSGDDDARTETVPATESEQGDAPSPAAGNSEAPAPRSEEPQSDGSQKPTDDAPHTCAKCSTTNDADARFCKACAAPLTPEKA